MRALSDLVLVGLIVMLALAAPGCRRHAASTDDCNDVLNRLVDLELIESGYRDPALRARWQVDLARRFAPDLARCRNQEVRDDLHACLATARTPEEIVHRCLD
jgi:hypothetical protein